MITIFSALFFNLTFSIGRTAGMFPRYVSGFVLLMIVYYLVDKVIRAVRGNQVKAKAKRPAAAKDGLSWIYSYALLIVFGLLIYTIGFGISTILYMIASPFLMKYRNLKVVIPVAVVLAAVIVFVFGKVFYIDIPQGILWEYFGLRGM